MLNHHLATSFAFDAPTDAPQSTRSAGSHPQPWGGYQPAAGDMHHRLYGSETYEDSLLHNLHSAPQFRFEHKEWATCPGMKRFHGGPAGADLRNPEIRAQIEADKCAGPEGWLTIRAGIPGFSSFMEHGLCRPYRMWQAKNVSAFMEKLACLAGGLSFGAAVATVGFGIYERRERRREGKGFVGVGER